MRAAGKRVVWVTMMAVIFFHRPVHAQQDPQFSQYFLNQFVFNPAYAGLDQALSVTAHLRAQWVGITGFPLTQNLSVHTPVAPLHGGMGIQVLNEQEGAMRVTSASVAYSFIQKSRIGKFSFGISGGMQQVNLDGSKLRAPDGTYDNSQVEHNDPILPEVNVSALAPDFSAGFFFSNSRLNLGISANHLVPLSISLDGSGSTLEVDPVRQYYFQLAYLAELGKKVTLRPAVFASSDGSNLQAEADAIMMFNNFFWVGAGIRGYNNDTRDGVIGFAGINLSENLRLGYAYDYTLSALKAASDGSHELVINYRVNLVKPAKPGKAIYNPRF